MYHTIFRYSVNGSYEKSSIFIYAEVFGYQTVRPRADDMHMVLFEAALESICTCTALVIANKNSSANSVQIRTYMYISYIVQRPKYLIVVVNRFRYINNNFSKEMCSIPMDMTVVHGLHKFSLQSTIDHHGPSMYSGHYTTSIDCLKKHCIATTLKLRKGLIPKTPPLPMLWCINWLRDGFCTRTGGWGFYYSRDAGISSPYH